MTTATISSVTRTRRQSDTSVAVPTRLYTFASGVTIHVPRSHGRLAGVLCDTKQGHSGERFAVLAPRKEAAAVLWKHRADVERVYEFPRTVAS